MIRAIVILFMTPYVLMFLSCSDTTFSSQTTTTTFGIVSLATLTTVEPPVLPLGARLAPVPPAPGVTSTFEVQGFTLAGIGLLFVVGFLCLIRASRRWVIGPPPTQRWCDSCGFDLVGLDHPACPECGESIHGTATTRTEPRRTVPTAMFVAWVAMLLFSVFLSPLLQTLKGASGAYNYHVTLDPALPLAGLHDWFTQAQDVYKYILLCLYFVVLLTGAVFVVKYLRKCRLEDTK